MGGKSERAARRSASPKGRTTRSAAWTTADHVISYRWDLAGDRLSWGRGAARFFGTPASHLKTGQAYANRIGIATGTTRAHTILFSNETDQGFGVPYRCVYGFTQKNGAMLWIEDAGRWFAGRDERPAFAKGLVRATHAPIPISAEAMDADFLVQLDRDFAAHRAHGGQSVLMAFAVDDGEAEIDPALLWCLRAQVRIGDRTGIVGGMLLLLARACPTDQARDAAERLAKCLEREAGQPIASTIVPLSATAQSIAAIQKAEQQLRAHQAPVTDPLTRALRALNGRTVVMGCQPIVHAHSRQPAFNEALARIDDGNAKSERMDEVVAALDSHGSITLLDHRMISLAIDALEQDDNLRLAVNVAPRSLVDADWFRYAEVRLSRRPDLARRLIVEITEQADWAVLAHAKSTIAALRDWGILIAIDDFGMGRTSLRHLAMLRADIVKIAGPFVQNIGHSIDDRHFIGAMIDMARQLNMKTVAEWVEDEATAAFLEDRGIDFMQGQLFGSAQIWTGRTLDRPASRRRSLAV